MESRLISFNSPGASLSNTEIDTGRMFTETEDNRHMEVVVLGADLKNRFFPNVDPIGKTVQIDGRPFQVVGVAKSKGSVFGQSQDNFVSIPIQTHVKIYGSRSGLQYNLSAINKDRMMEAEDEVRVLLRAYRHLHPDAGRYLHDHFLRYVDRGVEQLDGRHRRGRHRHCQRVHGGGRRGDHEHHAGGGEREDA